MLGLISSSLIENSVSHSVKQIGTFNSNFSCVHHHHEPTRFGLPGLAHHRHGGSMLISFEGFVGWSKANGVAVLRGGCDWDSGESTNCYNSMIPIQLGLVVHWRSVYMGCLGFCELDEVFVEIRMIY